MIWVLVIILHYGAWNEHEMEIRQYQTWEQCTEVAIALLSKATPPVATRCVHRWPT